MVASKDTLFAEVRMLFLWELISRAFWESFAYVGGTSGAIIVWSIGAVVTAGLVFLFRGREAFMEHLKANVLIVIAGAVATCLLIFAWKLAWLPHDIVRESNHIPAPVTALPLPPTLGLNPHPVSQNRSLSNPTLAPFSKHVEHPSGFLQFDKPQLSRGYDVIAEGRQFGMNFRSLNRSPERVLRVFGYTSAYILPATDQSDKVALKSCAEDIRNIKQQYASHKINGPEVGVGQNGPWGTILLPTAGGFSQDEASQIIAKKLRFYYVSLLIWTDLQGRVDWADDCRWLQIPDGPGQGELVWHFCNPPN
jgi:hypothetical protein